MRRGAMLAVALLCCGAWADIPPEDPPTLPDTSCVGKQPGAACAGGGRCVEQVVRRPNFTGGGVPIWEATTVLVCQRAPAVERSALVALGVALAAGLAGFALQRRGGQGKKPLVRETYSA
jgi:hypothetical protein